MPIKNKIIFFGTPKIAAVCLEAILNRNDVQILAVVCQPDKPIGRKHQIIFSPVKALAIQKNIPILQEAKISILYDKIKDLNPDLIFTCAFGQFIPDNILSIPKYHCINLHASILPKLRGGAPIHWAIIKHEKVTGFSLIYMTKKMDAGNIIKQYTLTISNNETYSSLYDKLCLLAQQIIKNDFSLLFSNQIPSFPQDEKKVTFGCNITRDDEKINWNDTAINIDALIRGLYAKPCAYTTYANQIIKIHQASIINITNTSLPGTILAINKNGLQVSTRDKIINLTVIQITGKRPCHVNQLINGKHIFEIGQKFI